MSSIYFVMRSRSSRTLYAVAVKSKNDLRNTSRRERLRLLFNAWGGAWRTGSELLQYAGREHAAFGRVDLRFFEYEDLTAAEGITNDRRKCKAFRERLTAGAQAG